MAVSAIALYASPPSSVCSSPYPCSMSSQSSYDFDLAARSSPAASSSATSTSHRTIVGGLSRLLKNSASASSSSYSSDELQKGEDQYSNLSSSFGYSSCSPLSSSLKRYMGPVSVSSSSGSIVGRGSGSGSFRVNGFVKNSLGSCTDHDVDELTFNMEDSFAMGYHVQHLLASAQTRHKLFYEDFVIKAFYEAERAHRGQVMIYVF